MKITLLDVKPAMVAAWKEICGDLPNVEIKQCSFHAFKGDAIVSPANSFGFMDGGIDWKYSEHYGWDVQARLQTQIMKYYYGELHVGQAVLTPITSDKGVRFVIAAPTMRSPMVLGEQTINPYLATRAALIRAKDITSNQGGGPPSICFPGMGTGCGKVPFKLCAHQMRRAIEQVMLGTTKFPDSWMEATDTTDELLKVERK